MDEFCDHDKLHQLSELDRLIELSELEQLTRTNWLIDVGSGPGRLSYLCGAFHTAFRRFEATQGYPLIVASGCASCAAVSYSAPQTNGVPPQSGLTPRGESIGLPVQSEHISRRELMLREVLYSPDWFAARS